MPSRTAAATAQVLQRRHRRQHAQNRGRTRRSTEKTSTRKHNNSHQAGCRKRKRTKNGRPGGEDPDPDEQDLAPERRDHTFCYNPTSQDLPVLEDFTRGFGALRVSNYKWGPPEQRPVKRLKGSDEAPAPAIPSWDDDKSHYDSCSDEDENSRFLCAKEKKYKPAPVRRSRRQDQPAEASSEQSLEVSPEPALDDVLQLLPRELRLKIFRELLIAEKPFHVYAGWTRVYKRDNTSIEASILRCSKQLYHEGVSILYGENTFLYRLRDAPLTEVTNVNRLAFDDGSTDDDEDMSSDDGSEWSGENVVTTQRRSGRTRAAQPREDIDVAKFLPLFRHVIVEAEYNRYGESTQRSMAQAIAVFSAPNDAYRDDEKAPNIHTITVRVTPRRTPNSLTFVDFFDAENSPVIQALKLVECQFLRVDILTDRLSSTASTKGIRFTLDMRHRRMLCRAEARLPDIWADDQLVQCRRSQQAALAVKAIDKLQGHVIERCSRYQPEPNEDLDDLFVDDEGGEWVEEDFSDVEDLDAAAVSQVVITDEADGTTDGEWEDVHLGGINEPLHVEGIPLPGTTHAVGMANGYQGAQNLHTTQAQQPQATEDIEMTDEAEASTGAGGAAPGPTVRRARRRRRR